MRVKLADQWKALEEIIERADDKYIKEQLAIPSAVWSVDHRGMNEANVDSATVRHERGKPYCESRVTKVLLEKFVEWSKTIKRDPSMICLHISLDNWRSGFRPFGDTKQNRYFIDKAAAVEVERVRAEEARKKDDHKEAGGKFCKYCGKIIPIGKEHRFTIIFQGRNDYGNRCVVRQTNDYCPDSHCGGRDQMAHEG